MRRRWGRSSAPPTAGDCGCRSRRPRRFRRSLGRCARRLALVAAFLGLIRRDLRLSLRQGGEMGLVLGFFVLAVLLFPFGVGPEPELLRRIAAGIIWVAALLAAVISLDRLFAADHADGSLDLIALSALPLEAAVLAKAVAHWLTTGLP